MGRIEKPVAPEDVVLRDTHNALVEIASSMAGLADQAGAFSKTGTGDVRVRKALQGISLRVLDYRKTILAEINTMQNRFPLRLAAVLLFACMFATGCGIESNPTQSQDLIEVSRTDSPNMIKSPEYKSK